MYNPSITLDRLEKRECETIQSDCKNGGIIQAAFQEPNLSIKMRGLSRTFSHFPLLKQQVSGQLRGKAINFKISNIQSLKN